MIPETVLRQLHAHLRYNCCFVEASSLGFAAQWERPANGTCPDSSDVMAFPSIESVLQEDDANPQRYLVATFSLGACQIPVVIAQCDPSRAEVFPRHRSLALALSEHGIVIDPCQKSPKTRYPSPLNLMLAKAGAPRLLWRGKPEKGEEEADSRWLDRLAYGSLDAQFQPWITRIRRWEKDGSELSRAHLASLASNLSHELGWGFGQWLLTCINRLRSTDALRSHLRLIYVEASKALRQRARTIRAD